MVPEGYEKLATIGILYKGQYSSTAKYKFLSAVYYNGSTFVALKDNPVGAPTGDGINWQYMAKGFVEGVLSAVNAKDTSGVLGTVGKTVNSQTLVDAIADKVMTKLLQKNKVLQTVEQVMASKDAENVTGAAATAELNRKLTNYRVTSVLCGMGAENGIGYASYIFPVTHQSPIIYDIASPVWDDMVGMSTITVYKLSNNAVVFKLENSNTTAGKILLPQLAFSVGGA